MSSRPVRTGLGSRSTWPSAASTVVGVVGDPIAHSLSPLLHNTAFAAMGIDWVSVGFEVNRKRLPGALEGMRSLEIAGLSVTTPNKELAAQLVDDLTPLARRLEAVNCISLTEHGQLIGDSTDGQGFVDALRHGCGFDPRGRRCAVLGAGGAARAVAVSLVENGARELVVVNRTRERAEVAAELLGDSGRVGMPDDVRDCELVVQATSVGMVGAPAASPIDADLLGPGQLLADLVYVPAETSLMKAARERGAEVIGGLGMLVHQASIAIERWTGSEAPVSEMWRAARSATAGR